MTLGRLFRIAQVAPGPRYTAEGDVRGLRDDVDGLQRELVEVGSNRIGQSAAPNQLLSPYITCKTESEVYSWLDTLPDKVGFANVENRTD